MEKEFYRETCIYNFISEKPFKIEKEKANMLSMEILFKLYDLNTGKEILFNKYYNDEIIGVLKEEKKDGLSLKKFYLSDYIKIFVDKYKLYKIVTDDENLNKLGFKVDFEIVDYYKYSSYSEDESNCNIKISKEIFLETLKKNINNFLKAKDRDFKLNLPISYKNHYKVKI
jgi:putative electron transport protein SCO1/senC